MDPALKTLVEFFAKSSHSEEIYKAMKLDDASEVVVAALIIIKRLIQTEFDTIPQIMFIKSPRIIKDEAAASTYRNLGNNSYHLGDYQTTLKCYNQALMAAPANSREMMLAYSNRSALFLKLKVYNACLQDIGYIYSLGCTDNALIQKLEMRMEKCLQNLSQDVTNKENYENSFGKQFFKLNVERNTAIPCASTDVGVVIENQLPKVVATKDISVGTVVAVEKAFVSTSININSSCDYCLKSSLNLIPCDQCTYKLYCDQKCKEMAKKEYHDIECNISDRIEAWYLRGTLRAVIRMKQMCKSWDEMISVSYNIGRERMKTSSVNEIFDGNNKFCLLNFDDSRAQIKHGTLFNYAISIAVIIYHLETKTTFFPRSTNQKNAAIRAVARIMVNLLVFFPNKIMIEEVVRKVLSKDINKTQNTHCAWLGFISKLKHSCDANLLALGLNNKVALVALQPIKKGAELNISFIGDYYHRTSNKFRAKILYLRTRLVCNCKRCTCTDLNTEPVTLSPDIVKKYGIMDNTTTTFKDHDKAHFKAVCKVIAAVCTFLNTPVHMSTHKYFMFILRGYQHAFTENYVFS